VFNILPVAGYHVAEVLVDGSTVGAVATYTFFNVTADHTIAATFEADPVPTYTIIATAGANGTITPFGDVTVNEGDDQVFNILPVAGYHVAEVLVDGSTVGAVATYTFTNVTADHTIAATFEADLGSVIIDNGDPETSYTGTWAVSSAPGWHGTNSVWSRDGSIYRWTFSPSVSGYYDVAMWWTTWSSRSTNVPVIIEHAAGATEVNINQQLNGSQWNSLDDYFFESGSSYNVTITAQPGPSSTCADAVRFMEVPAPEHIYACLAYGWEDLKPQFISTLQDIGAYQEGDLWKYRNENQNKTYVIHFTEDIEGMKQALKTEGAYVIIVGHSNYGLGAVFPTPDEIEKQVIDDILYIDDDRIFNYSSPWIHVSLSGMRTGQAYPYWWPIFQDGTSGIMPYDFGPQGDPPYNYYITYQVPGDPTFYKVETVSNSALERFPDSGRPAWYSPDGTSPDPTNPDHLKCYITNPEPWSPSFESIGDWVESRVIPGYFKENYLYTPAGQGDDQVEWIFRIPEPGQYKTFAWWSASQARTPNAPYTVNHAFGSTTIPVDQRINGGQWNEIGEFYFDAQEYSVILSNDADAGNVVADAVKIAHVDNPPEIVQADFYARIRNGTASLEVTFINQSTGDLTDRLWDFGDGNTNSTRDYITHTYTAPGTYTVSLTVSGPLGSDTKTKVDYITVGDTTPVLQAEFSASRQEGILPLETSFRDRSSGNIVSWFWDFSDGETSEEQNPTHTYLTPGNYTVSLTVIDADSDSVTETKENFIVAAIFDKSIDNVDYPKTHYRNKTILFRRELEIPKEELKYSRMFYEGCNSGNYYLDTFNRGVVFYTVGAGEGRGSCLYLKAYLEGKSDEEAWELIQNYDPVYDYYDFNKLPSEQ
jgi:PKD repeat protein